jgi:hypothetical protein
VKASANRVTLLAILAALCVVIQLTPRPPNVEFTSLIVFFVGALFGALLGGALGTTVMLINGCCSSWGYAGLMMPFQITGMAIIGVAGGVYSRAKKGAYTPSVTGETAVLGAFLTLVYDVITNFGVAVSYMLLGVPVMPAFVTAIVSGAIFSVIHVVSNCIVFSLAFYPLTKVLQAFLGGEKAWTSDISYT